MKPAAQTVNQPYPQAVTVAREVLLVIGASLAVALCARFTVPLWWTPVPLTLGNFAVVAVGLALGSKRGFAALALYLAEGAAGLPVFTPTGPGGLAQLLGPTGGYLLAYPVAALAAGWIAERGRRHFLQLWAGAVAAELVIFTGGVAGLMAVLQLSAAKGVLLGVTPFLAVEPVKIVAAVGVTALLRRTGMINVPRSVS